MTLLLLFILVLALGAVIAVPIVFLLELIGWTWTGVPYVPIPKTALKKLAETLVLSDASIVYDLGSGDGRVLIELAKHSNARFIGIEKAPLPFLASKIREQFARQKNVKIVYGDIDKTPLVDATHVYAYLLSDIMDRLLPKFEKELRPGTRLVSCDFRFTHRTPDASIPASEGTRAHVLHVYTF